MWWASFFLIFMCTQEDLCVCVFIFFLLIFLGISGEKKNLTCFHFKPKSVVTIDQLFFRLFQVFLVGSTKSFPLFFWVVFTVATEIQIGRANGWNVGHRITGAHRFFFSCELCEMIVVMNPKKSKTRISVDWKFLGSKMSVVAENYIWNSELKKGNHDRI